MVELQVEPCRKQGRVYRSSTLVAVNLKPASSMIVVLDLVNLLWLSTRENISRLVLLFKQGEWAFSALSDYLAVELVNAETSDSHDNAIGSSPSCRIRA